MKTEAISWIKKQKKTSTTKKTSQKTWTSAVVTEKKHADSSEANVSVFTKTTNPKIIIESENLKNNNMFSLEKQNKYNMLIFFCFIIMCIIILATFFLSLQTYDTVNKLAEYIIL